MSAKLFFWLRIGAMAVLLALLSLNENRQLFPAFRLFTFIFVFLLLAILASLLRGRARDALIIAASLAMGLSLCEGGAMLVAPAGQLDKTSGALWVPRPDVGWGAGGPGRYHHERIDSATGAVLFSANYTIDRNLLRQTRSCEHGPAVVFFGCSYTFGDGVEDADTLPQAFADLLQRQQRVLNLGYEGYGPQQFLRALETGRFDAVIGPRPAQFIFLTAPWHAERTACKAAFVRAAPRYALENGAVVYKGACVEGARLRLQNWLDGSVLYRVAVGPWRRRIDHDDIELYIRILLAAVDMAKQKYDVPTLIAYICGGEDYLRGTGFDDDLIIARLRAGGAEVVDASLAREAQAGAVIGIKGDGHPTPLANRLRSLLIWDAIGPRLPDKCQAGEVGQDAQAGQGARRN